MRKTERKFQHYSKGLAASLTRNEKNEPLIYEMHTHETAELFCFLGGKAVFHIEGNEYRPESGDILFIRPAEAHYITVDKSEPYERVVIDFDVGIFSELDPDGKLTKPLFDRKAGTRNLYKAYSFKNDMHILCIENIVSHSDNERVNILSNLMLLLSEISYVFKEKREETGDKTLPYQIIRYINLHLNEPLTLDSVCEHFYISKTQLERIFKKATGSTMGRYITVKRLIKSKEMLNAGKKPTEVYMNCGFRDYSAFYRAYVKNFGETPSQSVK